jgi:hypothetical protein
MDDPGSSSEDVVLDEVLPFGVVSDIEGGRWWVTAIERWRETTVVQYTVETEHTHFGRPMEDSHGPPMPQFLLALSDDVGTHYEFTGGGAGGASNLLSGRAAFRTPISPEASSLMVTLHQAAWGSLETVQVGEVSLALPPA